MSGKSLLYYVWSVIENTMKQVIGFATQFYTLWDVNTEEQYFTDMNGNHHHSGTVYHYSYLKNISSDLDTVKEKYPNLGIDENLRGRAYGSWKRTEKIELPVTVFSFGKFEGTDFATCDDVWQLNRAFNEERSLKRRVNARKRLVELGEMVRVKWVDTVTVDNPHENAGKTDEDGTYYIEHPYINVQVNRNYMTRLKWEQLEKNRLAIEAGKHLHKDGEKVKLSLKKVSSFGYEGSFGWVSIVVYESIDGGVYKYKGSSPPYFENDGFVEVSATVKHGEYNGAKETLLQRIKVLAPKSVEA